MARIFISHSSKNDTEVDVVSKWLSKEGFNNHFVDHLHISLGTSWSLELPKQASNADIMILYVTQPWLSSSECFSEYRAAYYGNKIVIPLLVTEQLIDLNDEEKNRLQSICSSVQGVSITDFPPNEVINTLLKGSLVSSSKRVEWLKRKKLIRILSIFAIILTFIAAYFRDYLGAHAEKVMISFAFQPLTKKELKAIANKVEDKTIKERQFLECKNNNFCPDMIILPSGSYWMGGARDDPYPDSTEFPNTKITIPTFAVSVNEITNSQWLKCYTSTQFEPTNRCKQVSNEEVEQRLPVSLVSWNDAKTYTNWLNQQIVGTTNGPYRLLSEAEWEYAVRGFSHPSKANYTIYPWGDSLDDGCKYGNIQERSLPDAYGMDSEQGAECERDNGITASKVGSFEANNFGLKDMSGNLTEWVEDCWHDTYHNRPRDESAWIGSANCERVVRGGSWIGQTYNLRTAARSKLAPDLSGFNIGFRVGRDLDWAPEN